MSSYSFIYRHEHKPGLIHQFHKLTIPKRVRFYASMFKYEWNSEIGAL